MTLKSTTDISGDACPLVLFKVVRIIMAFSFDASEPKTKTASVHFKSHIKLSLQRLSKTLRLYIEVIELHGLRSDVLRLRFVKNKVVHVSHLITNGHNLQLQ